MAATGQGRASARVKVGGRGETNVATGLPVLDHLLATLAVYASFDLTLDVEPGSAELEITAAARSLGEALHEPLRADGARGHGSAVVPADEALAHVALEASGRPLLVSNVDLSQARIAGLAGDLAARFLEELAQTAGLTLHVRLVEGKRHAARARSDLQGARRRTRTGMPTAKEERRMKEVVRTEAAPAPFQGAPYSQAIKANGFVFVAGQVALKPGGHEITGETIQEQTEQALANLGAILEAAGSGFDRLVKTTVFLQHLDDFQGMNEVYATKVGDQPPARSTVEVAKLPSGALVEIEAIALI